MNDEHEKWLKNRYPEWRQHMFELSGSHEIPRDICGFEKIYRPNRATDILNFIERISKNIPPEIIEGAEILGYQKGVIISQALLDFKGAYAAYSYQDQKHPGYAPESEWVFDPDGSWNDEVEGTMANTGFKVVSYQKRTGDQIEIMICFAGTEGGKDASDDVVYGINQYIANCDRLMEYIAKYPNAKFHFTGHSLGGGLAQYFAYKYAKEYFAGQPKKNRQPESLTVTTFNAFGAEYGIRKIFHEEMDLSLVKDLKIQCFFAMNDLVSRLAGRHLGPTFGLDLDIKFWLQSHLMSILFDHFIRENGLEDRVDDRGRLLPGVKADPIPYLHELQSAEILAAVNQLNFNQEHGSVESMARLTSALLLLLIAKPPTKELKSLCDFLAQNTAESWDEILPSFNRKITFLKWFCELTLPGNLYNPIIIGNINNIVDFIDFVNLDDRKRKEAVVNFFKVLPDRLSKIGQGWKDFANLTAENLIMMTFLFDTGEELKLPLQIPTLISLLLISSQTYGYLTEKIYKTTVTSAESVWVELESAVDKLSAITNYLLNKYQTAKEKLTEFEQKSEPIAIFLCGVLTVAISKKVTESVDTIVSMENEVVSRWEIIATKLEAIKKEALERLTLEIAWDTVAVLKYGSMFYNFCVSFYEETVADLESAKQGMKGYAVEFGEAIYDFLFTSVPPLGEAINEVTEIELNQLFKDQKVMEQLGLGQEFSELTNLFKEIQPKLHEITQFDTIIKSYSLIADIVNYEKKVQPVLDGFTKMLEIVDSVLKGIDGRLAAKDLTDQERQQLLTLKKHYGKMRKVIIEATWMLEKKESADDDAIEDDGGSEAEDKRKKSPPPPPPGGGGRGVPIESSPLPEKKNGPPPPSPGKGGTSVSIPIDRSPSLSMDTDDPEAISDFINVRNSLQNIDQGLNDLTGIALTSQAAITQPASNLLKMGAKLFNDQVPNAPEAHPELIQEWQMLQNETTALLRRLNEMLELSTGTQAVALLNRMKENVLVLSKATGRIIKQLHRNEGPRLAPAEPVLVEVKEKRAKLVEILAPSSRLSDPGGVLLEFATPVVQVEDCLKMQYPVLLSLKCLAQNLSNYPEPAGRPFELTYPASLDRIYGMVVDQAADEVYLLGDTARKGKGIQADDLIVALQAICREKVSPAISLDPEPGNPAGPQWTRIDGCPPDSAFARQMLDADYEMKRIQIGASTAAIPAEFHSYARLVQESCGLPGGSNNRFWLCPFLPYVLRIEIAAGLTLFLFNIMVRVKTQNMVDAGRMTKASGGLDPLAEQAALSFSDHYPELEHNVSLGNNYFIFHQLRRLFDLAAVSTIVNNYYPDTPIPQILGSLPIAHLGELAKAPLSYEGISRELFSGDARIIVISGGVDLSLRFQKPKPWTLHDNNLNAIRKGIAQLQGSQTISARIAPLNIDTSSIGSCLIDDPITIAQTFMAACKAKQAHDVLVKAIEADPAFAEAQAYLAVVNWKMGDFDSSRIALEKALALNPNNPFVRRIYKQFTANTA